MPEENKSELMYERKNVWLTINQTQNNQISGFSDDYKLFITNNKTERECVDYFEKEIAAQGYKDISQAKYIPGERLIINNHDKNLIMAILGKKDITEGVNLIASHIDSPRLDLKPLPLVEESGVAMMKTNYYGGIKKYQWLNIPMSLHGIVIKGDGTKVKISIGEDKDDPIFTIPDLLPHLSKKIQGEKKIFEAIEGENLNLFVGSIPVDDKDIKNKVKETVLKKLNEMYGIKEEDLISAELEAVPAYPARDIGLDRSMIGAYGHDDRSCSYAAFRALLDVDDIPDKTLVVFLVDKEEIGSYGVSGARGKFFLNSIGRLLELKDENYHRSQFNKLLDNSFAISGDVGGLVNPMFTQAHDINNSPKLGHGIILEKYTGSRGKYGASDASAELMGKMRKIFNDNKVVWQPGALGKVDEGGGGTIAHEIAEMGIQVVDCGVGVIGMHSPFEIVSKADLFETYKGYKSFLNDA